MFVTVTLPGFAPANGNAVQGAVVVSNQTDVTQTVTMTLAAGPHLILPEGVTQAVTVGGRKVVSQSLAVANGDPYRWFGEEEAVTVTAVSGTTGDPQTIGVYVQGKFEAGLYAFVTTAVNKASPLLIIVAFFVPLLGAALQKYAEKFQAEQEKRDQEKKDQQEKRAQKLVEQFQNYICVGDVEKAADLWGKNNWLAGVASDEWETGNALIKLAKLEGLGEDKKINSEVLKSLVQNGRVWPDAYLAAYTIAWDKCRENKFPVKYDQPLDEARSLLPISEASQKFQDQLAQIEMEIVGREKTKYTFQPILDWPVLPPKPFLFPASDWIKAAIPGGKDPFADIKSETNLYYLYRFQEKSYLFWNGHPLFDLLFRLQEPALVLGESGSGRTAMAYGMHFFATRREVFVLHLPGTPSEEDIQKGFATNLWDFIRRYPKTLRLLTSGERQVVARLLVNCFGRESVVGLIENAHTHLFSPRSRIKISDRKICGEQLLLLNKAVKLIKEGGVWSWCSLVHAAIRALRFERVYLVLDAPETAVDWISSDIIPRLQEWQAQGLYTILFVPNPAAPNLDLQRLPIQSKHYLTWNKEQFTAMIERRYQAFAGERRTIYELFEDDAFEHMVNKCQSNNHYNPQRFMQLWQQITRQLPADKDRKINKDDIDKAVKALPPLDVPDLGYPAMGQSPVQATIERGLQVSQTKLRNILVNYFDREELRDICFDYDIDYENFGENKKALAKDMINAFKHIEKLDQLSAEICRRRPNIDICTDSHT